MSVREMLTAEHMPGIYGSPVVHYSCVPYAWPLLSTDSAKKEARVPRCAETYPLCHQTV